MRAMASDFFATNPLMAGPQVAMLIFLAVFGVVIWRVMRSRAADYEAQASLPLEREGLAREAGGAAGAVSRSGEGERR